MNRLLSSKEEVKKLPENSGVYMFRDLGNVVIYVGKAKNLKNRVSSYFSNNLSPKTRQMVKTSVYLTFIPVDSEFEALLLEAKLVKKYQPKYNAELRDDKSPLYIGITKEEYPRVITLRQTQLSKISLKYVFGPFLNSTAPKKVLRRIRRAFPFSTHIPGKRPCVYKEIGLCSPCPSEILQFKSIDVESYEHLHKKYKSNIVKIKNILNGNIEKVKNKLERSMKEYSDSEEYEKAQEIAGQIRALEYVTAGAVDEGSYMQNPNLLVDIRNQEMESLKKILEPYISLPRLSRIECFDIAHLAGTFPTASMVTFIEGEPEKSLYRHYKVKDLASSVYRVSKQKKNDDVASMKSILIRRKASFKKWGTPDLIIVDGGKGQVGAAIEVLADEVPVVGLAKQYETLIIKTNDDYKEVRLPNGAAKNLVQRLRNEAHRFARRYHHSLVSKAIRDYT